MTASNTLRIGGVPEHFNLPWRLAIASDAFKPAGIRVVWQEMGGGTGEMTQALRENKLDLALVLTEGAVADILRHDSNRLAKVWVGSPLTWGIHVAATSPIHSARQIQNHPIAISRFGSGSHLIPIVDAALRGWPTESMNFVTVGHLDGARAALRSDDARVFFWEKHMTQPLVDSGEFRRVGQRVVPWPAFVVSGRKTILEKQGRQVRAVLDIATRIARNLKRRSTAAALISETYGIKSKDVTAWLADVRWTGGYRRPTSALKRVHDALTAQGVIPSAAFDPQRLWQRI